MLSILPCAYKLDPVCAPSSQAFCPALVAINAPISLTLPRIPLRIFSPNSLPIPTDSNRLLAPNTPRLPTKFFAIASWTLSMSRSSGLIRLPFSSVVISRYVPPDSEAASSGVDAITFLINLAAVPPLDNAPATDFKPSLVAKAATAPVPAAATLDGKAADSNAASAAIAAVEPRPPPMSYAAPLGSERYFQTLERPLPKMSLKVYSCGLLYSCIVFCALSPRLRSVSLPVAPATKSACPPSVPIPCAIAPRKADPRKLGSSVPCCWG